MKIKISAFMFFLCAVGGFLPVAEAHNITGYPAGFASGLSHPFLGSDHLLAMLAVGIWAWQLGDRATWLLPASFVSMLSMAAGLAFMGFHLPMVEQGIACSILLLGLLISGFIRLPTVLGTALVGWFALYHGYAHGLELPVTGSPVLFGVGFILASVFLVGLGMLIAKSTSRLQILQRLAGYGLIVASGLLLN